MSDDSRWRPPDDSQDHAQTPPADRSAPPFVPAAAPIPPTPQHASTASAPIEMPSSTGVPVSSEPPPRTRRSRWFVGGATVAVAAVGAAGVFAAVNLTASSHGGAASADELGLSLLTAIENEDVLGVIDMLLPGEREVFRDPLVDLVGELTRLDVLSAEADLSKLLGVDVTFENEQVSAISTNVVDIVNLDLRADATVTIDGAEIPAGALITENLPDDMLIEMRGTRVTETDDLDIRLTAVEDDDRWYFSVFHTIAEYARAAEAPGALIPVEGLGSDPAASPEAAADRFFDRVESLDLAGLISALNPGEAAALQRYAPLFLDDLDWIDDVPFRWEITRRDLRFTGSGDQRTMLIDAIAIEGSFEGEPFEAEFADGCVSGWGMGETIDVCEDEANGEVDALIAEAPEVGQLFETLTDAFADIDETGVEFVADDDGWYLSPMATASATLLAALRALDRSELDDIVEQVPPAIDAVFDSIFGRMDTFPTMVVDDDGSSTAAEVADWERCYEFEHAPDASACFADAVAAGDIDPSLVPVVLRHSECGYDAGWDGSVYEMSDEDFVATIEASRPCFLDLVEAGVVPEWELPTEIADFECFEGRNWYTTYDDADYDDRYLSCLNRTAEEDS